MPASDGEERIIRGEAYLPKTVGHSDITIEGDGKKSPTGRGLIAQNKEIVSKRQGELRGGTGLS